MNHATAPIAMTATATTIATAGTWDFFSGGVVAMGGMVGGGIDGPGETPAAICTSAGASGVGSGVDIKVASADDDARPGASVRPSAAAARSAATNSFAD